MRKSTGIFLFIKLLLYIGTLILSIITLMNYEDRIEKKLVLAYIITDSISVIYILYRFCYIKTIFGCTEFIKFIFALFNCANIIVILYYIVIEKELLAKTEIQIYIIYEILFSLKLYFHIISFIRYKGQNVGGCKREIISELEKKDEEINVTNNNYNKEMNDIINENTKLKEERVRLNNTKSQQRTNNFNNKKINNDNKDNKDNFNNKKIEMICAYVKSIHGVNIRKDSLYKNFFDEIKDKCGLIIDKNKYEEIALDYAKEKLSECLKCPLTHKIFSNPYITPEGQTFDKNLIMKKIAQSGKNPITNNKLTSQELIENTLVLDICEKLIQNYDYFNKNIFNEIKNLLKSKETKKFYENPVVINNSYSIGRTKEGNTYDYNEKYQNLVIKNLIEQNREILEDNFLVFDFNISEDNKNIDNIDNINNIETTTRNKFITINTVTMDEDIKKKVGNTNLESTEKINVLRRLPSQ